MGVINLTPNSFSDGNVHFNSTNLAEYLLNNDYENLIYDFGMESTAPMNQSIDIDTEKRRFQRFLNDIEVFINDRKSPNKLISIDTYRPEFFKHAYTELKKIDQSLKIIFNDVSGVVDTDLLEVLKVCPDSFYIFTHNRITKREETLSHMRFVVENDQVIDEIISRFESVFNEFEKHKLEDRLIFDPGFGFAKSFDENWRIIKSFSTFEACYLAKNYKSIPLVLGLSKKSFLRKVLLDQKNAMDSSEYLHFDLIKTFMTNSKLHLIYRVHNFMLPLIAQTAIEYNPKL